MWKILNYKKPDDYVIATGTSYSVKEFVNSVAKYLGIIINWSGKGKDEIGIVASVSPNNKYLVKWIGKPIVVVDERYFRPAEVENLLGDSSKAKSILGWEPKTSFDQLVSEMIENDINEFKTT